MFLIQYNHQFYESFMIHLHWKQISKTDVTLYQDEEVDLEDHKYETIGWQNVTNKAIHNHIH